MSKPFIHTHVHTEFSPLDGLSKVSQVVEIAKNLGHPAIAITDHGTMAGVPEFYYACRENGIIPILGQEFYIVPDASNKDRDDPVSLNRHLVMMALNEKGWHAMVELTSIANERANYHYKPRIDHDILREYREDFKNIAVTSACLSGEISRTLTSGGPKEANKVLKFYRNMFPNFYLELQRHPIKKRYKGSRKSLRSREEQDFEELQENLNRYLLSAGKRFDVPFIVSNDSHYVEEDHHDIHDMLLAVQTKSDWDEEERFRFHGTGYYLKSEKEMRRLFSDVPEAWRSSQRSMKSILDRVGDFKVREFDSTTWHIPKIPGDTRDPAKTVRRKCFKRLGEIGFGRNREYKERLRHELSVIREANFEQIFLIVEDYVNFARDKGIIVGPGRGSMVGSIVSWLLGITEIDPIKHKLLFERAINPARPSIPDFDIDFENDRCEEVIDYVRDKYGEENVVLIGTHQHMAPRLVIKNILRTLGVPFDVSIKITSELPDTVEITNQKKSGKIEDILGGDISEDLKELLKTHKLIEPSAVEFQGLVTSFGTHAAGVIISDKGRNLEEEIPKMLIASSGKMVSQFDMDAMKHLHLVKFDFLRLSTLKMIAEAIKLIGYDPFERDDVGDDFYDKDTYEMITKGDLTTVFQFQGGAAKQCILAMGIETFEELSAANSLARPGAIKFLGKYVEGKKDPKKIDYPCKEVKPILEYTYGVILYQEQVMEIVKVLAGWDDLGADRIKEATKYKSGSEFDEMKPEFFKGCKKNGIKEEAASRIWNNIDDYRAYGFNRAHSIAYSSIGFKTAYLKCHYPKEWFTAVLNTNPDKNFEEIIEEIRRIELPLLLPDVNRSDSVFALSKKGIRFGLSHIRGMGTAAVRDIIQEREDGGKFESVTEFRGRMSGYTAVHNKARLSALQRSGALRSIGGESHGSKYQEELLGVRVTNYPLDPYRKSLERLIKNEDNVRALNASEGKPNCYWGGIVTSIHNHTTKRGDAMAFVKISFYGEQMDVVLFPDKWLRYGHVVKEGAIVAIGGQRDTERNSIIAGSVRLMDGKE